MSLLGRNSFAWASTMFVTLAAPVTLVAVTPLSETVKSASDTVISAISFVARSVFGAPAEPVVHEPTIEESPTPHALILSFLQKSKEDPNGLPVVINEVKLGISKPTKRMVPYFKEYWTREEYDNLVGLYSYDENIYKYVFNSELLTEEQVKTFVTKGWVNQQQQQKFTKLEDKVAKIHKSQQLYFAWNKIRQSWPLMKELILLRHALPYTQRAEFEAAVEKTIEAGETRFNLPENVKFDEVVAVLVAAEIIAPVDVFTDSEAEYTDSVLDEQAKNGIAYYLLNPVVEDTKGYLKEFHELTERQRDGLIRWGMGDGVTNDWLKKWKYWNPADLNKAIDNPTTGIRARYESPAVINQYADLGDYTRAALNRPHNTVPWSGKQIKNTINFEPFKDEDDWTEEGYLEVEFNYPDNYDGPMVKVRYDVSVVPVTMDELQPKWQVARRENADSPWGPWQTATATTNDFVHVGRRPSWVQPTWTDWREGEWGTGYQIHINPETVPMPPAPENHDTQIIATDDVSQIAQQQMATNRQSTTSDSRRGIGHRFADWISGVWEKIF